LPRAARVADLLKRELRIAVDLVAGERGEFTVWVDDQVVSKKGWRGFPNDEDVLGKVRAELDR